MPIRVENIHLETIFNCLIDSFIADKVGISQNFLNVSLAAHLKENLRTLYSGNQLHSAGIGNETIQRQDKLIRSDKIYWLDPTHQDPAETRFFSLMDLFVQYLNSTCFTGITGYEFHYTYYESGSFYKKHLDQFRNNTSRAYSMILYLNSEWEPKDGGELCIYLQDHIQTIAPENGTCVFFKSSELEHEVLITNEPRLSITGWLKVG